MRICGPDSPKHSKAKGITLVEILIATVVFLVAFASLLSSIMAIFYLVDISNEETVAVSHLRNMMEKIKSVTFVDVTTLFPNNIVDGPPGNNYSTLIGGYTLKNEHIIVTYPDVNSDPLQIHVELTWQDKRGRARSIGISTFKTR